MKTKLTLLIAEVKRKKNTYLRRKVCAVNIPSGKISSLQIFLVSKIPRGEILRDKFFTRRTFRAAKGSRSKIFTRQNYWGQIFPRRHYLGPCQTLRTRRCIQRDTGNCWQSVFFNSFSHPRITSIYCKFLS